MGFRRRPPTPPPDGHPGPPPDEQVTLVEGRPPPPPDDLPPGPPPGEPDRALWPWLLLLLVLVLIGAGLVAYFATRDDNDNDVQVPKVVGFKEAAARASIHRVGLDTNVSRSFSDKAAGFVVSQAPGGGEQVAKGSVVALVVSRGPSTVAVPNVASLTVADAVAQVTQAGLRANVVQVPSSETAGRVIAQNPDPGTTVQKGSTVRLNVSRGPTQTTTVTTTTATTVTTETTTTVPTTPTETTVTTVP